MHDKEGPSTGIVRKDAEQRANAERLIELYRKEREQRQQAG